MFRLKDRSGIGHRRPRPQRDPSGPLLLGGCPRPVPHSGSWIPGHGLQMFLQQESCQEGDLLLLCDCL